MTLRSRVPARKQLGGHQRSRNKNPKLSPYQRELKRNRLANQTPKPVNVVRAGGDSSGEVNPVLLYQRRDTPANSRTTFNFLEQQRERNDARKAAKAAAREAARRKREREAAGIFEDSADDEAGPPAEAAEAEAVEAEEEASTAHPAAADEIDDDDDDDDEIMGDDEAADSDDAEEEGEEDDEDGPASSGDDDAAGERAPLTAKKAKSKGPAVLSLNEELMQVSSKSGKTVTTLRDTLTDDEVAHAKRKAKKHEKKIAKRRVANAAFVEAAEVEIKALAAVGKNKKLSRKEERRLAQEQLKKARAGLARQRQQRAGAGPAEAESTTDGGKLVKRLSALSEAQLRRQHDRDDRGVGLIEKIRVGEQATAPPQFADGATKTARDAALRSELSSAANAPLPLPSLTSSIGRLAQQFMRSEAAERGSGGKGARAAKAARTEEPAGPAGQRAPQNKPGKNHPLAFKTMLAAQLQRPGDVFHGYGRKSTAAAAAASAAPKAAPSSSEEKQRSEFEAMREKVMSAYRQHRVDESVRQKASARAARIAENNVAGKKRGRSADHGGGSGTYIPLDFANSNASIFSGGMRSY